MGRPENGGSGLGEIWDRTGQDRTSKRGRLLHLRRSRRASTRAKQLRLEQAQTTRSHGYAKCNVESRNGQIGVEFQLSSSWKARPTPPPFETRTECGFPSQQRARQGRHLLSRRTVPALRQASRAGGRWVACRMQGRSDGQPRTADVVHLQRI